MIIRMTLHDKNMVPRITEFCETLFDKLYYAEAERPVDDLDREIQFLLDLKKRREFMDSSFVLSPSDESYLISIIQSYWKEYVENYAVSDIVRHILYDVEVCIVSEFSEMNQLGEYVYYFTKFQTWFIQ